MENLKSLLFNEIVVQWLPSVISFIFLIEYLSLFSSNDQNHTHKGPTCSHLIFKMPVFSGNIKAVSMSGFYVPCHWWLSEDG